VTSEMTGLVGVYNADGGLFGELRYVLGHLRGTAACALCDITHGRLRRKPAFDAAVRRLDVPFVVKHRNELDPFETVAVTNLQLPVILAQRADHTFTVVCDAAALTACNHDVDRLFNAIIAWIDNDTPHASSV
jgi:hypothetical protein